MFLSDLLVQARPQLNVAAKYALVELTPPKLSDIPAIRQGKYLFNAVTFIRLVLVQIKTQCFSSIFNFSTGISKLIKGATSGAWKNATVKEAWLNTLVTVEVLCWFYVGECIGKRHYVGYDV